jgi:hypothetical protein
MQVWDPCVVTMFWYISPLLTSYKNLYSVYTWETCIFLKSVSSLYFLSAFVYWFRLAVYYRPAILMNTRSCDLPIGYRECL